MAKRADPGAEPYRPVRESLVRAVVEGVASREGAVVHARVGSAPPSAAAARASRARRREKRVLLSPAEEDAFDRTVAALALALGSTVKPSHVLRACVRLVTHAGPRLHEQALSLGPLPRPPNGDAPASMRFEHELARLIARSV